MILPLAGKPSYERVRAFVWHLSAGEWTAEDGGQFIDEVTNDHFQPRFNSLVHFGVPRPHRVCEVMTDRPRFAAYGWIVIPQVVDQLSTSTQISLTILQQQYSKHYSSLTASIAAVSAL